MIQTMADARLELGRLPGQMVTAEHINRIAGQTDYETWLRLRLEADLENIASLALWAQGNDPKLSSYASKIAHYKYLLSQLRLLPAKRETLVILELEQYKKLYSELVW